MVTEQWDIASWLTGTWRLTGPVVHGVWDMARMVHGDSHPLFELGKHSQVLLSATRGSRKTGTTLQSGGPGGNELVP